VSLPVSLAAKQYTPLMVAVQGGSGELHLTQERGDGETSAGYTIALS
jgi:hypothetical protein